MPVRSRRRGGPRVPLGAPAKVETVRGVVPGTIRDVSRGGVYLVCPPQPVGQNLTIHFEVGGVKVDCVGEVRYAMVREGEGSGMGIKFVRLEGGAAAAIGKHVDASGLPADEG